MKKLAIFAVFAAATGWFAHDGTSQSFKVGGHFKIGGKMKASATSATPATSAVCNATSTGCTAISISGEAPSPTCLTFAGTADPSIKQDPQTGTWFMGYSWPNCVNGAAATETHLAKSTDSGTTWTYVGVINPSVSTTDPVTGNAIHGNNEVVTLLPYVSGGITYWIQGWSSYYALEHGGGTVDYTARFAFNVAAGNATTGPLALAGVTPEYIGTSQNNQPASWPTVQNFQTINAAMSTCTRLREPTLIVDPNDGKLVMLMGCGTIKFTAQFVTNTSVTAGNWVWSYITGSNTFATNTDAVNVCAYLNACSVPAGLKLLMTEPDISQNTALTKYVMQWTLATTPAGGRFSYGAVTTEVDLSSRPYTFLRTGGNIIVDASVTSTDSATGGPGSSTFGPGSNTGVIIAHKRTNCTGGTSGCSSNPAQGGLYTYLMQSFLKP